MPLGAHWRTYIDGIGGLKDTEVQVTRTSFERDECLHRMAP